MRTTTFTDFSNNPQLYVDSVLDNSDTVIINRGSDRGVVLISLDEYNSLVETEYILSSPAMVEQIREAQREIAGGEGKRIATADLWK